MSRAVPFSRFNQGLRSCTGLALCAILVAGSSLPAQAEARNRLDRQESVSTSGEAADDLRAAVSGARAVYNAEVKVAKAQYELALTPATTAMRLAMQSARTKADRKAAQAEFAAAQTAAASTLAGAKSAAAAKRDAAIDKALAEYLLASGKSTTLEALRQYQTATKLAGATLELALDSAKAAYKTDTGDERDDLSAAIAAATTSDEQATAWSKFEAATRDEQAAYRYSVNSARSTYDSALRKARSEFRKATGTSTTALEKLPFQI